MRKTSKYQFEMVSLEELVSPAHEYREHHELINFDYITVDLRKKSQSSNYEAYGITSLFCCLLLQVMEDLSDRQLERYLRDSTAARWFCGFGLADDTPTYSTFSKTRKKIGTSRLSKLFIKVRKRLEKKGFIREVFNFVDASDLIAKSNLWKERDQAIAQKYEKLNNETLPKVAVDKEARIGVKGKNKFWYGYEKHVSVDMQSGLINKVAITPANVTDAKGLKHVCPNKGVVFADKAYCTKDAQKIIKSKSCEDGSIKKNNMDGKNKDLDKWRTRMRMPYEGVFSKTNHRVRYRGIMKNQFFAFLEALVHNIKRLVVLEAPPIFAT